MGTLLDHLGRACADAREGAQVDQYRIAASAGVSRSTIGKFEGRAVSAPRRLEQIVLAYAAECDADAFDLWTNALRAWRAERDG